MKNNGKLWITKNFNIVLEMKDIIFNSGNNSSTGHFPVNLFVSESNIVHHYDCIILIYR